MNPPIAVPLEAAVVKVKLMNRYIAKLIGTFALVFAGTGAIVINKESGGAITHVGIAIVHVATGSKEQGMFAGLAIGSTVLLEAMFAGPICGASMNPARSIAPAVVSGHTEHLWIYIVAPLLGAALAIPTWIFLNQKKNKNENSTVQ